MKAVFFRAFRRPSITVGVLSVLAAVLAPGASQAQGSLNWPRVYDQQCTLTGPYVPRVRSGMYIYDHEFYGRATIGQSFVPTLSQVGFLQVALDRGGDSGTFTVNLHEESIAGPILSSLDGVLPSWSFRYQYAEFEFASPVNVVPGRTYVFELLYHGTDACLVSCLNSEENDLYTGGTAIRGGQERPFADLWFREGVVVPEPSTIVLMLLSVAALAAGRWCRRRA